MYHIHIHILSLIMSEFPVCMVGPWVNLSSLETMIERERDMGSGLFLQDCLWCCSIMRFPFSYWGGCGILHVLYRLLFASPLHHLGNSHCAKVLTQVLCALSLYQNKCKKIIITLILFFCNLLFSYFCFFGFWDLGSFSNQEWMYRVFSEKKKKEWIYRGNPIGPKVRKIKKGNSAGGVAP